MPSLHHAADEARAGDAGMLGRALADTRAQTLRSFEAYAAALPALGVPLRSELNPPLWELGHIGWFQEWWIGRNPARGAGQRADPLVARPPSRLAGADHLYDSSAVPHDTRWSLPLPDATATRDYLAATLDQSLALLPPADAGDDALYFHRLALFHEDMHNEAAIYMAHGLGFAVPDARLPAGAVAGAVDLPAGRHRLGWDGPGFAFDNELTGRDAAIAGGAIDAAPVTNARFAAFVEAGGYADERFWSAAGRAWRGERRQPRFWRRAGSRWEHCWFGAWRDLDAQAPATNLSCHEAEAWCAWAGRRLPTEAEWEIAATTRAAFAWGEVWEWTADAFLPYPGFVPHPYRDYSAPWFGTRRVLRGGSVATHPRMKHPRYRNFFTPERNDIFAGFRSCPLP
ncbi:MAG: SUMF1/EgtB/PvdO family nonheme iron enzyme [Burkholderiales bacterium]|nr:SUMF1/EgtB/PvdO family nonheme iron enzyme [Burkholderiales bacterium]